MKILSNSPGVLWDCHMHSSFSADSDTPTEDMIRRSIALGLEGICFTEHLDPDYPPLPMTWNSPLIFRLTISGLWS